MSAGKNRRLTKGCGFTLIELMVVMAVIGLLATLVLPRYFQNVDRARESVLQANLAEIRSALDKHYSDTGRYPDSLAALVERKYLRQLPVDPITKKTDTWTLIAPTDNTQDGIYDVRSGAAGRATDGSDYASW